MDDLFSDDRQRIADAIAEAEAATSAEIVPYVVVQCDVYPAARWRGALLVGAVYQRAVETFLEHGLFDTDERTGILLFVSLSEHRIEVLADQGIDARVDAQAWSDVTDHIRRGIERCGRVLEGHGLAGGPDGDNELADRLRHYDE
jgi:uncharacterized membrane protein